MKRTREEVLAYIDDQLGYEERAQSAIIDLGGWYVPKERREESYTKDPWHYGKVELSCLVDFIYEDKE